VCSGESNIVVAFVFYPTTQVIRQRFSFSGHDVATYPTAKLQQACGQTAPSGTDYNYRQLLSMSSRQEANLVFATNHHRRQSISPLRTKLGNRRASTIWQCMGLVLMAQKIGFD
jgi:hypothetical protein